ncbi:MAG: RecQ family ATP-dependent DNA helicase, partial [Planctomycetaceae bacterium]|nr:RecQ family ATP-dependent DNA helicase [Planctomycetaceae bacterium]
QVPAVCRDGLAIVVSPLISLMKDQVDAARACGIAASFINSTQIPEERRQVFRELHSGKLKLLYIAPERVTQDEFLRQLQETQLSFIAIDEAHCVSMWGHDFRPHYRELHVLREQFPTVAMHAYTATATPRVQEDIARQLGLREPELLVGEFDRPNLTYRVERRGDMLQQIRDILDRHPGESGIIYCITRKDVETYAAALQALGIRARPYHAGLNDDVRHASQDAFIDDEIDIIVATVAFGMGIDKPNVRFVIHTGMPASIENYQQESGRAGRDGLEAECHLFYGNDDVIKWEFMLRDQPDEVRKVSLNSLQLISNFCHSTTCRHRSLVQHFGQDLEADCGSGCDLCMGGRDDVDDPLKTAQMILSSVFRQQQRFGASYTAQVLKGSRDQKILANGHDQLSTYGLLKHETKQLITEWIGQLIQQGYLIKNPEFGQLQLTDAGVLVLKGETTPRLLRPQTTSKAESPKSAEQDAVDPKSWEGVDRPLFEHLRDVRLELARERGVPPYVIFGDAALRDMARKRPTTPDGFLMVNGVGKKKCLDFGERFVEEITRWSLEHALSTDVAPARETAPPPPPRNVTAGARAAFPLFAAGTSIDDVAEQLGRARSTVSGYLVDYLREERVIDASPWVDSVKRQQVEAVIEQVGAGPLKPIYMALNEQIDYETIRVVLACFQNRDAT